MRAGITALIALVALGSGVTHAAPEHDAGAAPPQRMLEGHLALLAKQRLGLPPAESVDELDALLERAYRYDAQGRRDEATMLLLEAVEGPRFRSFESLPSFETAELTLASLLIAQRALSTAERAIDRLLARGPSASSFGPAVRRAVDVALVRGDHAVSAAALAKKLPAQLPEDAASELAYLRGLAAHEAGAKPEAQRVLKRVSTKSRFYPNAQYLLGTIAAASHAYAEARAHFCAVRKLGDGALRARYASPKLHETEELAALGLARIAHEEGRHKAAFDHYFQVPFDTPRLAEALFESAYASYERGRHDLADDSLAQLEARYPHSPFTAEAKVLRGYVDLARCDFARAERELSAFERTFGEVLRELDATLASEGRTHGLFSVLASPDERAQAAHGSLLIGLLGRDPEVDRLRAAIAALDDELARGKHVRRDLLSLAERVHGGDAPKARLAQDDDASDDARSAALAQKLVAARTALGALRRELAALRKASAKRDEVAALAKTASKLEARCDRIAAALRSRSQAHGESAAQPSSGALEKRLAEDAAYVRSVRSRAMRVLVALEAQLELAERRALETLRARLEKELRRARIGRIDAVMGRKRQLELEVESLAAGRFPPELVSQKTRPTLLRDDEEFWPFEGEVWADEREEPPR